MHAITLLAKGTAIGLFQTAIVFGAVAAVGFYLAVFHPDTMTWVKPLFGWIDGLEHRRH